MSPHGRGDHEGRIPPFRVRENPLLLEKGIIPNFLVREHCGGASGFPRATEIGAPFLDLLEAALELTNTLVRVEVSLVDPGGFVERRADRDGLRGPCRPHLFLQNRDEGLVYFNQVRRITASGELRGTRCARARHGAPEVAPVCPHVGRVELEFFKGCNRPEGVPRGVRLKLHWSAWVKV